MLDRKEIMRPGAPLTGTAFTVVRYLGSGSMGAAYEVVHRELGKSFVAKVLHSDLVEHVEAVGRLRREWRLLASIGHPCVVAVSDAGVTQDGIPYFIMEHLMGETLAARMKRKAWRLREILPIAMQVAEGLSAIHAMGIVHRDIKPANVFLTHPHGLKILDFGIAKMQGLAPCLTKKGATLGTPRYIAPEQAMGHEPDFRADLYSLGIILYEMLSGHHPFEDARTPVEMMIAQTNWTVPVLPERSSVESALNELVLALLAKEARMRPRSASHVALELAQVNAKLLQARALGPPIVSQASGIPEHDLGVALDNTRRRSAFLGCWRKQIGCGRQRVHSLERFLYGVAALVATGLSWVACQLVR